MCFLLNKTLTSCFTISYVVITNTYRRISAYMYHFSHLILTNVSKQTINFDVCLRNDSFC